MHIFQSIFVFGVILAVALSATILRNNNNISIYSNNGVSIVHHGGSDYTYYCGTLICPKNTYNCRIITKNSPNDTRILITVEQCTDEDAKILDEYSYQTKNPDGIIIDSVIDINPEYVKKIQEEAQKIANDARQYASDITANALQQAAEIQNTVREQISSAFSNVPLFKALGFTGFPFN